MEHVIRTGKHLLLERCLEAKMDKNPYLLGTADGVINLRTGELAVGAPDMWVTKRVAVAYHGLDHPTPDVDAFFNDVFNRDDGVIAFLQRFLGYGITGLTVEEAFAIFHGKGGNGKGVLVEMLEATLGDYYVSMHPGRNLWPAQERARLSRTWRSLTASPHSSPVTKSDARATRYRPCR